MVFRKEFSCDKVALCILSNNNIACFDPYFDGTQTTDGLSIFEYSH